MLTEDVLNESLTFLRSKGFGDAEVGIILGTGLGQFVDEINVEAAAHYHHIPFFPISTGEYHSGKLLFGTLQGKKVVMIQGRFHLYEGYDFVTATYFTGAALSLFSPPPLISARKEGLSGARAHKWLATVHLSAMIATLHYKERDKSLHRASAYTAVGAFATATLVLRLD